MNGVCKHPHTHTHINRYVQFTWSHKWSVCVSSYEWLLSQCMEWMKVSVIHTHELLWMIMVKVHGTNKIECVCKPHRQLRNSGFWSSGMWFCIARWMNHDLSKDCRVGTGQIELFGPGKCLLYFRSKSSVLLFAVQIYEYYNTPNYNISSCFTWVWNLVSYITEKT